MDKKTDKGGMNRNGFTQIESKRFARFYIFHTNDNAITMPSEIFKLFILIIEDFKPLSGVFRDK